MQTRLIPIYRDILLESAGKPCVFTTNIFLDSHVRDRVPARTIKETSIFRDFFRYNLYASSISSITSNIILLLFVNYISFILSYFLLSD